MTTYDDLIAGLDAPSAESLWNKDDPAREGDTVAGRILRIDERETEYGVRPILTLRVEAYLRLDAKGKPQQQKQYDGDTVAVHCYASILAQKIDELRPKAGGRIAIRFDGERSTKDGKRTYKAWSAHYQPPAPGADLVAALDGDQSDEEPF
jgi:hypothetical protein